MDEYIKREDAMKALDEYRISHTMSMHGDMELLIEFRDGVVGAMNALAFVPTADVVPKSEVARKVIEEIFLRIREGFSISELGKSALNQLETELKKKYTEENT